MSMDIGRIFSRGSHKWIFPEVSEMVFPGEAKVMKFHFSLSKLQVEIKPFSGSGDSSVTECPLLN